ncbi:hypothetical protein Tco_0492245 [Tanacetum coccineum]
MRDIVRLKTERELVRITIDDGNAFWKEIGVNAGVLKLMLLSLKLNAAKLKSDLKLDDAEGTDCYNIPLPTATIFAEFRRLGENLTQKLTFYKAYFSSQWKFLIHTILQCLSAKTTSCNEFSSTMASAIICLATNKNFNFSKYIFDNMVKNLEGGKISYVSKLLKTWVKIQLLLLILIPYPFILNHLYLNLKRQSQEGNRGRTVVLQSYPDEDNQLRTTKSNQALEIKRLTRRVKSLEKRRMSRHRVDASKQGKEINDLDVVAEVSLGDETNQFSTTTIMSWTLAPALIVIKTELEEEERISRLKEEKANIALLELWDNTQAIIDANFQLAQQMQTEEQEHLSIKEKSTLFVELLENRKKHFAALRAQEKRIKPPTKVQKINTMSTYLKNMAGYKHNQLKSKSYDEIRICFDKEMKRVNTFVDINTAFVKSSKTRTEGSSKRAGDELGSDNSKKQKIDKHVEAKKDDDQEEAEMKKHIEIVKDDEVAIDAIPLATKPLVIVKYKIVKEGKFVYFQLIRADGSSKRYLSMIKMLPNINRETWRPSGSWLKLNMGIQGQG